jgi:hypothetical protein
LPGLLPVGSHLFLPDVVCDPLSDRLIKNLSEIRKLSLAG